MTETADITRAARALRGTPETISAEIADLLEAYPREPRGEGVTPRDHRLYREATAMHWLKVFARRRWLVTEFCRLNGWRWRPDDHFTRTMLAEGRKRRGARDRSSFGWSDHDYFLRDANGMPAAVAGHPYDADAPERRAAYARDAASHGLRATFPTDFPSWWYPGRTTLVLFERPWGRMPVLRPLDDIGDWWTASRRDPFDRADVERYVPWPSEAEGLADVAAMVAKMAGDRRPCTMTLERLHVLHDHHPSQAVRMRAFSALAEVEKCDFYGEDDDGE